MGWFDEQIRERMAHDDDMFSDAMAGMATVIMGEKLENALNKDNIITNNAIEDILKYYHIKVTEFPEKVKDIDKRLEILMRPKGIMRRAIDLTDDWYNKAVGPMLAINKETGTTIALIPNKFNGYKYFDKETEKFIQVNKKTAKNIDVEAICFYKPLPLEKLGIKEIINYMLESINIYDTLPVFLITAFVSLLGFLVPKLNNIIYAYVIPEKSHTLFWAVFGFMLSINLAIWLITASKKFATERIKEKVGTQLEAAVMMRTLSLPANFFKKYSAGEIATRINYIRVICGIFVDMFFSVGLTALFSLFYILQMAKYAAVLVIPGILTILLSILFTIISTKVQNNISQKQLDLKSKEFGMNYALITGIQKIKLSGAEKRAFSRWAQLYKKTLKNDYDPPIILKFGSLVETFISLAGVIVIYYFTIVNKISVADYFAFNASYAVLTAAFSGLLTTASTFFGVKPVLDMLKPILEEKPEVSENRKVVNRLSGGLELNNVSFKYNENSPLIIDNLSLKIKPNEYIAITGSTGCGKSTLMRLMLGFETPQKGVIYYDGQDMKNLDLKSLRQKIGTVLQDGKLFQGDIFSNITITATKPTMEDAWDAAKISGIDEDIEKMPMGMNTIIAEGSGGISGGQRQRILIARAIASKPKILMFDEATSALDNITQKKVSEALYNIKATRIVIAHRLSTIKQCDRIIVMDGGKIVEDGSYDKLMENNGFFAELVKRQQLNKD